MKSEWTRNVSMWHRCPHIGAEIPICTRSHIDEYVYLSVIPGILFGLHLIPKPNGQGRPTNGQRQIYIHHSPQKYKSAGIKTVQNFIFASSLFCIFHNLLILGCLYGSFWLNANTCTHILTLLLLTSLLWVKIFQKHGNWNLTKYRRLLQGLIYSNYWKLSFPEGYRFESTCTTLTPATCTYVNTKHYSRKQEDLLKVHGPL